MAHYLIVYNPRSGRQLGQKGFERLKELCRARNLDAELWMSADGSGLEKRIEQALTQGVRAVVAAGGDGTISRVGRLLVGGPVPLGIVALGTGNALAHHLGVPTGMGPGLDVLEDPVTLTMDTGRWNGQPFISFWGVGVDAEVAAAFSHETRRNLYTYVRLTLQLYPRFVPEALRLQVNGTEHQLRPHLLGAMNIGEYGHRARFAPQARVQDGQLDLCSIVGPPLWMAAPVMTRIWDGSLHRADYYSWWKARRATLLREAPGLAQADGDPVLAPARIELECVPGSLQVLVPNRHFPQPV